MDAPSIKAPDAFRTISEVAAELDLPQHVLRFWETRFAQIKPMKRGGGRRYYRPEDIDLLRGIRLLLYGEGFTIRGVQRLLKEKGVGFVVAVGQSGSVQTMTAAAEAEAAADAPAGRRTARRPAEGAPLPAEPSFDQGAAPAASGRPAQAVPRVPPAGRRRLEAVLAELVEAKRLLDNVR